MMANDMITQYEEAGRKGYVAFDLDGTLATFDYGRWEEDGQKYIGEPVDAMLETLKAYRKDGVEVRIVTARVYGVDEEEKAEIIARIHGWLEEKCGLPPIPVQCHKCCDMMRLYDDRAVEVFDGQGVGWREVFYTLAFPLVELEEYGIEKGVLVSRLREIEKMGKVGKTAAQVVRNVMQVATRMEV